MCLSECIFCSLAQPDCASVRRIIASGSRLTSNDAIAIITRAPFHTSCALNAYGLVHSSARTAANSLNPVCAPCHRLPPRAAIISGLLSRPGTPLALRDPRPSTWRYLVRSVITATLWASQTRNIIFAYVRACALFVTSYAGPRASVCARACVLAYAHLRWCTGV